MSRLFYIKNQSFWLFRESPSPIIPKSRKKRKLDKKPLNSHMMHEPIRNNISPIVLDKEQEFSYTTNIKDRGNTAPD
jgi:hypothetical protein